MIRSVKNIKLLYGKKLSVVRNMFAVKFLRFHRVVNKAFVRNVRRATPVNPSFNPGLDKRLQAFQKEGLQLENDNIEDFIEQSESDFAHVNREYNDFLYENKAGKDLLRLRMIREKYFKENLPNLLTWSEKEQIRYLNSEEPEEWTPEKLAESFPVTVEVVKKLLKYPWKPATEERIARHDASAMRNWRELKEGTLKMPEDLRDHFLKFSNRTIPPLSAKSVKLDLTQEKIGEFQKIVDQCATVEDVLRNEKSSPGADNDKEVKDYKQIKQNGKQMTLDELKNRINTRLNEGKRVDFQDQLILKSADKNNDSVDKIKNDVYNNYPSVEVKENNKSLEELKDKKEGIVEVRTYPDRIRIPKKSFKWGATYKVKDCYYDCDGRFLYRVIGLEDKL